LLESQLGNGVDTEEIHDFRPFTALCSIAILNFWEKDA